jgi:hypothetical protein
MNKKKYFRNLIIAKEKGFTDSEFENWFPTLPTGFAIELVPEVKDVCIYYTSTRGTFSRDSIVASKNREDVTSEWIREEIKNYIKQNGLMDSKARKIIGFLRWIFWIFPFYIIGILYKLTFSVPDLNTEKNLLGIGILISSILSIGMLFETSEEDKLQKQINTVILLTFWGLVNYGLCCLFAYLILGDWGLVYLWFW